MGRRHSLLIVSKFDVYSLTEDHEKSTAENSVDETQLPAENDSIILNENVMHDYDYCRNYCWCKEDLI